MSTGNKYSGPASSSFPLKLMELLDMEELSPILSWLPHGRGFTIHDKKRFAKEVLPQHFKVAQFTSFTRRMNRWNFTLQKLGNHKSNYFHPFFARGEISKCLDMRPKPQKVAGKKQPSPIPSGLCGREMMTNVRLAHAQHFAYQGRTPSLCSSNSGSSYSHTFNKPSTQSVGFNRNFLRMPSLPNAKTNQSPGRGVVAAPTTGSNDFFRQYYADKPSLPSSSRSFTSYGNHHGPHVMESHVPLVGSSHSSTEGSPLSGPYDLDCPSHMSMHHQMRDDPLYRASYDESLAESYAHHQAYLAKQLELSRLAFMNARRTSTSSNRMPNDTMPKYVHCHRDTYQP